MLGFWKILSGNAKFSIIAFLSTLVLGLLSMGVLGGLLYYPVSFLLNKYPTLNDWHGDWFWPAVIVVGMLWSVGFLIAGYTYYLLSNFVKHTVILYFIYVFLLWLWAAVLWYITLSQQNFNN